jgi:hypothetical protein
VDDAREMQISVFVLHNLEEDEHGDA